MAKEDFNKGDIKNYDGNSVKSLSFGDENSPLWYKLEERKKKWSVTVTKLVFDNLIKEIEKRLTYMTDKGGNWLEISFVYYENPDEEDEVKNQLFKAINEWMSWNIKSKDSKRGERKTFWILNEAETSYFTFDQIEKKFKKKKWNFNDYCRKFRRYDSGDFWKFSPNVKMPVPEGWRDFLDKGEYRGAVLIINWGGSLQA